MWVFCFVFVFVFFSCSLNVEFFQPGEESLPGDLLTLPHLATYNFSGSFGVSLHCYNKPAVSQLILAVLVFAASHQHSLLSPAKPYDAATCQPTCWWVPLPTGSRKQWVCGNTVWFVLRAPKVPRGRKRHKTTDCFKLSSYLGHFPGNLEGLKSRGPTICFTLKNYSAPVRTFLSHCYAFKKTLAVRPQKKSNYCD